MVAELAGITEVVSVPARAWSTSPGQPLEAGGACRGPQVAPSEITGPPYPPSTENEAVAHAAAQALRAVLQDIEVGKPNRSTRDRPAERTAAAHVRRPDNRVTHRANAVKFT